MSWHTVRWQKNARLNILMHCSNWWFMINKSPVWIAQVVGLIKDLLGVHSGALGGYIQVFVPSSNMLWGPFILLWTKHSASIHIIFPCLNIIWDVRNNFPVDIYCLVIKKKRKICPHNIIINSVRFTYFQSLYGTSIAFRLMFGL